MHAWCGERIGDAPMIRHYFVPALKFADGTARCAHPETGRPLLLGPGLTFPIERLGSEVTAADLELVR